MSTAKSGFRDLIHTRPSRATLSLTEGDLLVGRYGRSHLITLVERHSRYLQVLPIATASSAAVVTALTQSFAALPAAMARSLTWDRGIEMSRHAEFSATTGIPVFFCDAYSPWQRGSVQRAATSILPEEDRPVRPHTTRASGRRRPAQRPTARSPEMARTAA